MWFVHSIQTPLLWVRIFARHKLAHTSYQFLQRDFAKLMAISDCESASELFLVPEIQRVVEELTEECK